MNKLVFLPVITGFLFFVHCQTGMVPLKPPVTLLCEYQDNPLGIDVTIPRFSWQLNDSTRGAVQTAYRILVSSSREKLDKEEGDLWDSGKITSSESHLVEYGGIPLVSRQICFWKVMVWNGQQIATPFSEPARFEMALLNDEDWSAQWIGTSQTARPPRSVMFRKDFMVPEGMSQGRIYLTGLGNYLLYLNGQKVGKDLLTPGWTHYYEKVQYQVYDITEYLVSGKNTVGIVLGNMWWSSGLGWQGGVAYSDGPLRFIAQIELTTPDGLIKTVSDESWKYHASPFVENTIYHGVTYDSRQEKTGWDQPGYDEKDWMDAVPLDMSTIKMVAQQEPPIRVVEEIQPVSITEVKKGIYVFDFGINLVGYARLTFSGPSGKTIILKYAELLHDDGTVAQENLRSAKATDRYITSGKETEIFEPWFTYHGFQYVQVEGLPEKPDQKTLTALVFNSSVPPAGEFSCSNDLINQIQENIVRGQRSNLHSVPTDCPQRDERLGWMGDAQIFAPTSCYNMNMALFFSKWMRDIIDSQHESGYVYDVNPAIVVGGPSKPAWGDAVMVVPWVIYNFYRDIRIIEENYEGMKKWVEYMRANSQDDIYTWKNEENNWFGYGDWVSVVPSPAKPISAAYYYYSTHLLSKMAGIIGNQEDAVRYGDLSVRIRDAFNRTYFNADSNYYEGNTQTANLLPLAFGMVPSEKRELVIKNVAMDVEGRGYHPSTGFLGTAYLLPLLSDFGYIDHAIHTSVQTHYPSWGYMVSKGATTIWELWNSDTEPPDRMNSRNHFALGSVGEWYYGYLAGLRPDPGAPGFKRFLVKPVPAGEIQWARAKYDSPYGQIICEWGLKDDLYNLHVQVPPNTSAEIHFPFGLNSEIQEGGKPVFMDGKFSGNKKFFRLVPDDHHPVIEIGSGDYHFTVK